MPQCLRWIGKIKKIFAFFFFLSLIQLDLRNIDLSFIYFKFISSLFMYLSHKPYEKDT